MQLAASQEGLSSVGLVYILIFIMYNYVSIYICDVLEIY
jgi:hypothetical protein